MMKKSHAIVVIAWAVALVVLSQPAKSAMATATFATPEEATAALIDALRSGKSDVIERVLGPDSANLVQSGDPVSDAAERQRFLAAYDEHHELAANSDRTIIRVGNDNWPLPLPLVQTDGRWSFDTPAGAQELIDRRIGRNEIAAIQTALAYVDAQKAFLTLSGDGGQGEFAMRLVSSSGKHDGLYWPANADGPESPLAPLIDQAEKEGYPTDPGSGNPRPYRGYFFRILTAQGPDTPQGAINYVSDGRMTKGFALIAWPAAYGASGIMSFIVNQDGIVFQKDLGPSTPTVAAAIKLFDPDLTWARVDLVN